MPINLYQVASALSGISPARQVFTSWTIVWDQEKKRLLLSSCCCLESLRDVTFCRVAGSLCSFPLEGAIKSSTRRGPVRHWANVKEQSGRADSGTECLIKYADVMCPQLEAGAYHRSTPCSKASEKRAAGIMQRVTMKRWPIN